MSDGTRSKEAGPNRQKTVEPSSQLQDRRPAFGGFQADILALQYAAGNRAVDALLQLHTDGKPHIVKSVPPIVGAVLNKTGQPLDSAIRNPMEKLFGEDFSQVRVHTDTEAAVSARTVNALAYTAGQDVVFGAGQYAPETAEGQKLLAHELGHTLQQQEACLSASSGSGSTPVIMRAPVPGTADRPNLFGATIPAPTITRMGNAILATFYFGQDRFLFDASNFEAVEKLGEELRFMAEPIVTVDGYASTEGTKEYNQKLSANRRQTVIGILRPKLNGGGTISGKSYGESNPAVAETAKDSTELEKQRALNRRVTVAISSTSTAKPQSDLDEILPPLRTPQPTAEWPPLNIPPPLPAKEEEGPVEIKVHLAPIKLTYEKEGKKVAQELAIELTVKSKPITKKLIGPFEVSFGKIEANYALGLTGERKPGEKLNIQGKGELGASFTIIGIELKNNVPVLPKGTTLEISIGYAVEVFEKKVEPKIQAKLEIPVGEKNKFFIQGEAVPGSGGGISAGTTFDFPPAPKKPK